MCTMISQKAIVKGSGKKQTIGFLLIHVIFIMIIQLMLIANIQLLLVSRMK